MRAKLIGAAMCVFWFAGAASAQYPYGQPGYGIPGIGGYGGGAFMPNIYNPQTQPLSPYLNLFRGSNPATNYYYGVRPGTVGGGGGGYGGAPNIAMGGNRAPFFPQIASSPDPLVLPEADPGSGTVLPPVGHPVVYANTLGYFPSPFGMNNRGMRSGLMGGGAGGSGNRNATTPPRR